MGKKLWRVGGIKSPRVLGVLDSCFLPKINSISSLFKPCIMGHVREDMDQVKMPKREDLCMEKNYEKRYDVKKGGVRFVMAFIFSFLHNQKLVVLDIFSSPFFHI